MKVSKVRREVSEIDQYMKTWVVGDAYLIMTRSTERQLATRIGNKYQSYKLIAGEEVKLINP
jgi:hypothetical protein